MAKRKTPKVDLKPRAEKITDKQLKKLQNVAQNVNQTQAEIGMLETRKHNLLNLICGMQDVLNSMRNEFKKEYGTDDVSIIDGTIKYNENDNNEADKKNNDR